MKSVEKIPFLLLAILILIPLSPAYADAAPPMNPPGGDVSPEGGTQVQMLAEQVIIDFRQSTDDSGKVTAWFLFRNTGDTDENLKVRFPLNGDPQGSADTPLPLIKDLTAWIGSDKLSTQVVEDNDPNAAQFFLGYSAVIDWAEFDMSFPVGKNVKLTVNYTLNPTKEASFADVIYLMATGAGWKGPIGKADVFLRFPYILNQYNLPDYDDIHNYDQPGETTTVRENEVWIHWDNLEPTDQDNVRVSIIQPHLWQEVLQCRAQVIDTPDDPSAWLYLARAYFAADREKHGFFINDEISSFYILAFERALTLNPNNAALHIEFANGLTSIDSSAGYSSPSFLNDTLLNEIATALKLDPNNADALSLLNTLQLNPSDLPTPGPFPAFTLPSSTSEPTEPEPTSTPGPLPTSLPSATPTPTLTLQAMTQTPAAVQKPANSSHASQIWMIVSGLMLLVIGFGVGWLVRPKK